MWWWWWWWEVGAPCNTYTQVRGKVVVVVGDEGYQQHLIHRVVWWWWWWEIGLPAAPCNTLYIGWYGGGGGGGGGRWGYQQHLVIPYT